jgi:hypothetical protein
LRAIGMSRAYASAKHCGPSLVRSNETRATTTGRSVDRAMSTSAGANRTAGRMLLQRSRTISIPPGTDQLPPGDHRRPREIQTSNIVRRSVGRTFAWLDGYRINARDYRHSPACSEGAVYASAVRLMLNRLHTP